MQADRSITRIPVRIQSARLKAQNQPFGQRRAADHATLQRSRSGMIRRALGQIPVARTVEQLVQGESSAVPVRLLAGNHAIQIKDYQILQLNLCNRSRKVRILRDSSLKR